MITYKTPIRLEYSGESFAANREIAPNRIAHIVGDLPVILLELDNGGNIIKTYIHANGQILAQHDGDSSASRYFYLHDRLGSVRLIMDTSGTVKNRYIYNPFGELHNNSTDFEETVGNSFLFTGQYFDSEIGQYYLRARQYYPYIGRFTSRDPVAGQFEDPLSLHRYLYCENDPISRIDPLGLFDEPPALNNNQYQTQTVIDRAFEFVLERGFPRGPIEAFSRQGLEVAEFDYKFTKYTFQISDLYVTKGSEFTNWLTAYVCTYLYGQAGNWGTRFGGHYHALSELHHFDEPASRYFISGGVLMGDEALWLETGIRMSDWDFVRAKFDLYYGIERMTESDLTSRSFDVELDMFLTFWNSGSPR